MEIYLFMIIILFVLAVSDLIVGVSNDAVNFLNSAIGSKVATKRVIMIVASLGIMIGVTFSSGIMEVARKGIFHPDMFRMSEIMYLFLAVMFADIILLDFFNSFGLPTSTTVSIVFDLLGAAVAISFIKVYSDSSGSVLDYINTSQALTIVFGILISVIVAFSVGVIVQFLTRLLFSFNYEKYLKWFGGVWGGFALTAILYFIVVKGAKGTSFLPEETVKMIVENSGMIFLYSFIVCSVIIQLLIRFTKVNIFKPIVLAGTFGLALAFAANDLVNFIGVPLAGLASFNFASLVSDPDNLLMSGLKGSVQTPTLILLLSGLIMVITIWFSKKAQTVTDTTLNLSRQHEGVERFESSMISRSIVRMNISANKIMVKILPDSVTGFIRGRFDQKNEKVANVKDKASFDLIRASNNLVIASILISFATSLKLPLSTTYVTFMVAMGTSLADKAWGRESAVYRVNGVITVVGGWFFTAFSAFTLAFIIGNILFFGKIYAVIGMALIVSFIVYRSHYAHKDRFGDEEDAELVSDIFKGNKTNLVEGLRLEIVKYLRNIPALLLETIEAFEMEDRVKLKEERKKARKKRKKANNLTNEIMQSISLFKADEIKSGKRFGKIISSLQEIAIRINSSVTAYHEHIENNHTIPSEMQMQELKNISGALGEEIAAVISILETKNYMNLETLAAEHEKFQAKINELDVNQISRIQSNSVSTRNSLLYLNLLADLEIISNHILRLMNAFKNIASDKKADGTVPANKPVVETAG